MGKRCNMSSGGMPLPAPVVVAGVSSRRSACDRCRGQKLRCPRQHPEKEQCDRCARAHTPCFTSPIFRMRANISSTADDDTGATTVLMQKRRRHDTPTPPTTTVTSSLDGPESESTSSWETTWSSFSLPEWETRQFEEDAHLVSFKDTIAIFTDGPQVDAAAFVSPTSPSMTTPGRKDSLAFSSLPSPFSSRASVSSAGTPATTADYSKTDDGITLPSSLYTTSSCWPPESDNRQDIGQCTRRLSEINSSLISQLGRLSQSAQPLNLTLNMLVMSSAQQVKPNPVEGIVKDTSELSQVLKTLAHQNSRPTISPPWRESLKHPTSAVSESSTPVTSTDAATSLLILTCYINLMRLHALLFESICRFLGQIANSNNPSLQPVPGLSFNNFSLESGNLQATMFIQMITSLFQGVEMLLGLPSEFRIDQQTRNSGGILSQEDLSGVVEAIIKKEGRRQTHHGGIGGVDALRRSIKQARELLRDRIAP
ncbi:hypothetical protein B0T17DRAFT_203193 [Bombardia bombarda]|uniref:Zn(2)-C6 fungal-type domain-containing protein n=1 Tax=Bombardia bombarda TaxID=252184 RepID=A0AA39XAK6_9PEZI|nr:hypothetical protein B0T17DRAFT_203193 [Bombardia bombarda]